VKETFQANNSGASRYFQSPHRYFSRSKKYFI